MSYEVISKAERVKLLEKDAGIMAILAKIGISAEDFLDLTDAQQRDRLQSNYTAYDAFRDKYFYHTPCKEGEKWDWNTYRCIPVATEPPKPQVQKDQYGINKIYPDKVGGKTITNDMFHVNVFKRNYASGKPSEMSFEFEYKDTKANAISNGESTFYVKINGFKTNEPDTISFKDLGPDHKDGAKAWMIYELMTDGSTKKLLEIEDPHPKNHGQKVNAQFTIGESVVSKWIGVKCISYETENGSDRYAAMYIDYPVADIANPPNNWRKYWEVQSVKALEYSKNVLKPNGGNLLIRIDGIKKESLPQVEYCSKREIDPSIQVDPVPPVTPVPEPPVPEPEPPQPSGDVLYDGNIGKWSRKVTITDADPDFPKPFSGGKGMEMHASGNPRFIFDGSGVGTLEADAGHGRTYIDVVNNGSIFEYELRFNDNVVENHTCQLRSRHQEGGLGPNRQGGDSFKIDLKTVGLKLEKFHNEHIIGPEKAHNLDLKVGDWIKVKLTDKPDYEKGEIYESIELNGQKVIENTFKNLPPYLLNKADYDKRSYLWLRINNAKTGSVSFRNPKLTKL